MFCQKCGKEIQEEWMVCPNCGAALNEAAGGEQLQQQMADNESEIATVKSRDEIKKELASNAFAEKGGVVLFYGASGISRDMSKVLNPGEDILGFLHAFRNSIWGHIKSLRMFRNYIVYTNQRFIYIERGQMAFSWIPFFKKTVSIPYNEILNVSSDKRIGIFSGKLRLESTKKKIKLAMSNRKSAEELKDFLLSKK